MDANQVKFLDKVIGFVKENPIASSVAVAAVLAVVAFVFI